MDKTEQMLAALKADFGRDLTEEEENGIQIWQKCRELSHFVEGFPQEWSIFKQMLKNYLSDFERQWQNAMTQEPGKIGDLAVMQAQAYGAQKVVSAFISDVENAPLLAKEVPESIKEWARIVRAVPQAR